MKTKNKSFTLKILKKDLETAKYTDPKDCAISRAIKRKGGDFEGNGLGVDGYSLDFLYKKKRFTICGSKYENFSDKVHDMMLGRKKSKNFSIELNATVVK